ncbi:MAG: methionine--tRNA ligase [Candidatus Terrybacteria bacterium RIFCSPHIGHO2_02_41_19]|uniref:Methionine--tRNA ligase n=1 Tax=Candidatus Terrybacteria bacterium RIFCSPHIGHO2_02_41_19 TaxID=1802364 RepID=A0A1G2PV97_9BACT|nr:MAG: methionine--tRNA ligase [Candidatus Terrybacteria bacterium RIFCSPHIGHO2_02_41_19]
MEKFYLTTPIYYASGKPHIGHSFTSVFADVVARWQKSKGKDIFFSAGLDEHGSKIEEKAKKENKDPQKFTDEIAQSYLSAWKSLGIEYSDFIRTTSLKHEKGVLEFIKKLWDAGDIYEGEYEGLYCVGCENFVLERNLVDGLCPDHLIAPQKIKEKNYFFNLKKYLPEIKKKIEKGELKIIPDSRKNETLAMMESGVSDFSVTRENLQWGISFPYGKNQTIYVWADALMNYATVLDYPNGENFKKYWPPDLHIIGAEINKFHSIYWPAMLMSADLLLPKEIFIHGLFTVNGQKMSKTTGNIIDPIELAEKFGADAARYLLLSQFPASEHGDVKAEEFARKYNSDLANGIGNLLERSFTMMIDYRGGILGDKNGLEEKIKSSVEKTEKNYENNFDNYKLYEALADVFAFIKKLDVYINEEQPWALNKNKDNKLDMVLSTLLFGIEKIIVWLEPFMPNKIGEVKNHILKLQSGKLKKGDKLGLFPRI